MSPVIFYAEVIKEQKDLKNFQLFFTTSSTAKETGKVSDYRRRMPIGLFVLDDE